MTTIIIALLIGSLIALYSIREEQKADYEQSLRRKEAEKLAGEGKKRFFFTKAYPERTEMEA